jgi:hypothetical protein
VADYAHITSVAAEVLTQPDPAAHVSLVGLEILAQPEPAARVSLVGVEVLGQPDPGARISFVAIEVIMCEMADVDRYQGLALQPSSNLQGTTALGRHLPIAPR